MAAYSCMLHRLIKVAMHQDNFYEELNLNEQIAFNNGFNPTMIDSIIMRRLERTALKLAYYSISEE